MLKITKNILREKLTLMYENPVRDILDQYGRCHVISFMAYCEITKRDLNILSLGIELVYGGDVYMHTEYINADLAEALGVYRGWKVSCIFVNPNDVVDLKGESKMKNYIRDGLELLRIQYALIESKEVVADV